MNRITGQSGDQEKHWSCVHKINSNRSTSFSISLMAGSLLGLGAKKVKGHRSHVFCIFGL